MIIKIIIGINIIILSYGALSFADIYKRVDENGVSHFTNVPQGNKYKKIITESMSSASDNYDHIISIKSDKYDIEPAIIKAVITAESNWDPKVVSNKGAIGLMQLMPSTAKDMMIDDPYDPEENIEAGTRYLRFLMDKFNGDLDLTLAAYNAGPSRVEKAGGIPSILETIIFVKSVKAFYKNKFQKPITQIYKVTFDDGTILYTNTPTPYKQHELSKF